ncbi:Peptide methionine sulfoxide reductase MsrB [Croceitalea dokdonensis DOKDO 023]|uniref:peptide-methionine (R)-S-oxide reductase n=1 Tax=Croceitalea dokdonensis DOKDO 023 TaxID=1300341 RepID=A0A0P7ABD3_9FLAO|nr:peptide-methionine (R)-S-oxide reductase MsrB [Croceitalea dokdonensis]KPM30441.1 Peptide methionine sulfoxide reductase MsrB [Croceitalea dokdonensis DOKDO 023]
MKKYGLLLTLVTLVACQGTSQKNNTAQASNTEDNVFSVTKTDEEWRKELTEMEYYVLRKAATENAFSSDLLNNKEKGTYVCAGCATPLFRSENKFKSGTGWPSFDQEIEGNVAYDVDYKIGYARTEEHCATCGGHLGHVFNDGPSETTGKRHCINGVALDFVPDEQ